MKVPYEFGRKGRVPAIALVCAALLLAAVWGSGNLQPAEAQGSADRPDPDEPRRGALVYSVKYVCGTFGPEDEQGEHAGAVKPGNYRTAINITNPQRREVRIQVSAVRAPGFGHASAPGTAGAPVTLTLGPRQAIEFNCPQITRLLETDDIRGFYKGYVHIDSSEQIQVVGVYTAQSNEAEWVCEETDPTRPPDCGWVESTTGMSMDIEYVEPIFVR